MRDCYVCANKTEDTCKRCVDGSCFHPNEDVKKLFSRCYPPMDNGNPYYWNNTPDDIVYTETMQIGRNHYCVYCGEIAHLIQANILKYNNYDVTGYRCLCEGAFAEIKYKQEVKQLEETHRMERRDLNKRYESQLQYNKRRLFEVKQQKEKQSFESSHNEYYFFSTINGDKVTNQIFE